MEWLSFKFCLLRLCMWNISMVFMCFPLCVICSTSRVFSIVCFSPNTECEVMHNFCIYTSNQNNTITVNNQFPLCVPYTCYSVQLTTLLHTVLWQHLPYERLIPPLRSPTFYPNRILKIFRVKNIKFLRSTRNQVSVKEKDLQYTITYYFNCHRFKNHTLCRKI
jgi:hypothetical protein